MQTNIPTYNLSQHETENPGLVLYELFDYASLPRLKQHLWQWLRITVTGGFSKKYLHYNERENLFTFYEHFEKLLEAAYIIYSDRKEELRKQHRQLMEEELNQDW